MPFSSLSCMVLLLWQATADAPPLQADGWSPGLQKQYKLPLMRTDVLQASVDDSNFPVCVVAAASELNR